jgi:hypothetical protein
MYRRQKRGQAWIAGWRRFAAVRHQPLCRNAQTCSHLSIACRDRELGAAVALRLSQIDGTPYKLPSYGDDSTHGCRI